MMRLPLLWTPCLYQTHLRAGRDHICNPETSSAKQGLKFGFAPLAAARHYEHGQVHELGKRGAVVRLDDGLDQQDSAVSFHRGPAIPENSLRTFVIPIVNNPLEKVGISLRK